MKTIKQVSQLSGASVRTLQYYDNIHLLSPSRTASSYRLYSDADIAKLQQILFLKELGFSLKEIRELINHPGFNQSSIFHQQKELLCAKQQQVGQIIRVLERLENGASLDDCAADIKAISKESKSMKKSLKISLFILPIILLGGAFGIYQISQPSQSDPDVPVTIGADVININSSLMMSSAVRDIKLGLVDVAALPSNAPALDGVALPADLQNHATIQGLYSRDGGSEYEHLINYIIIASDGTRRIYISFSPDRTPIREMYAPEGEPSIINGHEVMLGQHMGPLMDINDTVVQAMYYYADFSIDGMNYNVETHDLSEAEVITLLKSLL